MWSTLYKLSNFNTDETEQLQTKKEGLLVRACLIFIDYRPIITIGTCFDVAKSTVYCTKGLHFVEITIQIDII